MKNIFFMKRHCVGLIFLIILVILVISYMLINLSNEPCNLKWGLSKDECIYKMSKTKSNLSLCISIKDDLVRNTCYFWFTDCTSITNLKQRYVCERLILRIHMNSFTSPFYQSKISYLSDCNKYTKDTKKMCLYNLAADISQQNFSKALDLCENLEGEEAVGECIFYSVLTKIFTLTLNTKEKIIQVSNVCSSIKNIAWKSECFFLLADELALLDNYDKFIQDIIIACEKSVNAKDYACFGHVTSIREKDPMPLQIKTTICDGAIKSSQSQCFLEVATTSIDATDFEKGVDVCRKITSNIESEKACFNGILQSYLKLNINNFTDMIFFCNNISVLDKKTCFNELGMFLAIETSINVDDTDHYEKMLSKCKEAPQEFKIDCAAGFISINDIRFNYNLEKMLDFCLKISDEWKDICYKKVIEELGWIIPGSYNDQLDACKFFPTYYQVLCTDDYARNKNNK